MATSEEPDSTNLPACCLCLIMSENVTTVPCGHDYCTTCADGLIGEYERTGSYSCTQCSETFYTKPGHDQVTDRLHKMDLCAETLEHTLAGASSSDSTRCDQDSSPGAEEVTCDACADSRQTALSSCLVCLSSYCGTHLRLHNELHARAEHTLVDATNQLQALTCSVHGKVLEVYCREEKQRICCTCMLEDHVGHDVVAAKQQEKVEIKKSKQMITEQERQLKELRLAKNTLANIANATEEECERLFTKLIRSISGSQSEMKLLIRAQERVELDRIGELTKRVDVEIAELKKSAVKKQNDIYVPQATGLTSTNVSTMTVNRQFSFGEAVKSMSALSNRIERIWQSEIKRISAAVRNDRIVAPTEPRMRKDFLQYLVPLTLDPDTAHQSLSIHEETQVECSAECQIYPDRPDRFDWWAQVLCREPLNTRCYWEAEWTGLYGVDVAVSYRDIPRKGEDDECGFGYNEQSWNLDCTISKYTFTHDNVETKISAPVSHKVGVYLDYKAGVVSFYSVSDCMELLHRAEARFTQPLYAGFGLFQGSAVRLCRPDREAKQTDTRGVKSKTSEWRE